MQPCFHFDFSFPSFKPERESISDVLSDKFVTAAAGNWYSPHTCYVPTAPTSLLFIEHSKHVPASQPLNQLFLLFGTLLLLMYVCQALSSPSDLYSNCMQTLSNDLSSPLSYLRFHYPSYFKFPHSINILTYSITYYSCLRFIGIWDLRGWGVWSSWFATTSPQPGTLPGTWQAFSKYLLNE